MLNVHDVITAGDEEDEGLEEEDLELLEENTGTSFKRDRLTRLHRRRDSESPAASSSKRRVVVESSDDDLDNDGLSRLEDIQRIWDDERRGEEDDDEMDDFIEDDEEEEGGPPMDERAREERRREKKQEQQRRKRARGAVPELAGIDAKYVHLDFIRCRCYRCFQVHGTRYTMYLVTGTSMTGP